MLKSKLTYDVTKGVKIKVKVEKKSKKNFSSKLAVFDPKPQKMIFFTFSPSFMSK